MVGREPRNYSLEGEIFWDLGTLRPWDLRDQSEVADKGVMVSSLSSLWSLWSLDLLGVSVFAVSWSLRSLRFCGLLGLFLKTKKMRSTEAERMKLKVTCQLVERISCEVIVKEYMVATCLVLNKVVNILYWCLTTPVVT